MSQAEQIAALEAECRQLREALDQEAFLLRGVTMTTLTGWWTWEPQSGRIHLSAAFKKLLGYSPEELCGEAEAWERLMVPEDLPYAHAFLHRHLAATQEPFHLIARYRHRTGRILWLLCRGQVVARDEVGAPTRVIGGHSDITEPMNTAGEARSRLEAQADALRRLNKALEARTTALERANVALEDFAYAASHDLQAPLRAIANFASWIDEDLPADASDVVREWVGRLRDRVERMTRLQENLLDYARITGARPSPKRVELAAMISDTWLLCAPPGDFELESEGPPGLEARLTEAALRTVLRNLFANAITHHDRSVGRLWVRYGRDGGRVWLEVADDGPGIPATLRDRLFRPTTTGSGPGAGTGMGLAIARRHAMHNRGSVELLAGEGRGARFRVEWPIMAEPVDAPAEGPDEEDLLS